MHNVYLIIRCEQGVKETELGHRLSGEPSLIIQQSY